MIDLSGITALPRLLGRVGTIRSSILQLGAPARLAGDPSGIRHLAASHLASSGRLTAAQERGRTHFSRLLDASWSGEASRSFAGYWADLERRLGRLAADHQRMAAALDGIAGDCERLNRDAMALAGAVESWLKRATLADVLVSAGAAVVAYIQTEPGAESLPFDRFGALDPHHLALAKTERRTVLGYMNEMPRFCEYATGDVGGLARCNSRELNRELRRELHLCRQPPGYLVPIELAGGSRGRPPLRVVD